MHSLLYVSAGCPERGVDYWAYNTWSGVTDTWEECGAKCDAECAVWTYRQSDKMCYTKSEAAKSGRRNLSGHISGVRGCPGKCGDAKG